MPETAGGSPDRRGSPALEDVHPNRTLAIRVRDPLLVEAEVDAVSFDCRTFIAGQAESVAFDVHQGSERNNPRVYRDAAVLGVPAGAGPAGGASPNGGRARVVTGCDHDLDVAAAERTAARGEARATHEHDRVDRLFDFRVDELFGNLLPLMGFHQENLLNVAVLAGYALSDAARSDVAAERVKDLGGKLR